jgi:hypothetical protein
MKSPSLEAAERWFDRGEFRAAPFSLFRPFTWVAPNHPIARRELRQLQQVGRRWDRAWGVVWFFIFIGPLFGSLACGVGAFFSSIINAYDSLFWLFGLWQIQILPTLALKLFASLAAAVLIAREREAQNWPLLRITPFSITNLVNAKLAGLYYWIEDGFRILLYGRGVLTLVTIIVGLALARQTLWPATVDAQWMSWLGGAAAVLIALFAFVELIAGVAYNVAVGLCVSAYSRASGVAIASTFLAQIVLWAFLFLPLERLSSLIITQFFLRHYPAQFASVVAFGVSAFLVPVFIEAGVAVAAYLLAIRQARLAD